MTTEMLSYEKGLSKLRRSIRNRPVGIVCSGLSLEELETRIEEFASFDICWLGINKEVEINTFLSKAGHKLDLAVIFPREYNPDTFTTPTYKNSKGRGNSLQELLLQLIELRIPTVYLFGADGYSDKEEKEYYIKGGSRGTRQTHIDDVNYLNKTFPKDTDGTKIYNVCPQSKYEPFERITYDKCLSLL